MGFSFAVQGMLHHALPDAPWRPLVSKFGYSVGFLIVILGRQQLFTENTLTVILPLLRQRNARMVMNVVRLWTAVLAANLAGALLFAMAAGWTTAFPAELRESFSQIGAEAMKEPAATVLVRAVFAGWLIALMVWLLPYAESARVWVVLILSYIVGLGQFAHVVAGSIDSLYMVVTAQRSIGQFLAGFLLPTLTGNIIGGVSLVAALAHAQFVAASDEGEEKVALSR
jgi:formate/nitrite transporter FocA (FNT family)